MWFRVQGFRVWGFRLQGVILRFCIGIPTTNARNPAIRISEALCGVRSVSLSGKQVADKWFDHGCPPRINSHAPHDENSTIIIHVYF